MDKSRIRLASALLALGAFAASAVPAFPGLMSARQADGKELSIRRVGDEYGSITLTSDGYPLIFNAATRNYEYAELNGEALRATGVAAADPEARGVAEKGLLASIDREAVMRKFEGDWAQARAEASALSAARKAPAAGPQKIVRISDVPTLGKHDVLVFLVEFANKKFSDCPDMPDPMAYYERFFHQEGFSDFGGTGSAHDFYYQGSCGKYDPQFRVFGPVTLEGNYADYAGNHGSDLTYRMIEEAARLVKEKYDVNFKDFDTDGDGKVDNVYCLYAGYGQADSSVSDAIWPHSYELQYRHAEFEMDGVVFNRYTVSQQVNGQTNHPVGIGTFVHEFGHVLGFADHYNTASSLGNPPNNVGEWDVMSQGSYNNNQNTPPTFSAFERYSLGWTDPKELGTKLPEMISMKPYIDSGEAYRVTVKANDREYFLIENRQQKGWDKYIPGHGILVWHIEEDQVKWDQNKVNSDQSHQMVDIVESSGIYSTAGSPSDPFPGSKGITSYNFQAWDTSSVFGFDWVEEDEGGDCRFLLSNSGYRLSDPKVEVGSIMGTSAAITVEVSGPAEQVDVTVSKGGEEVFDDVITEGGTLTVGNLEPETDYTVTASTRLGTLVSEKVKVNFSTLPLQIEEKKPVVLPAADVKDTEFIARWTGMPEATDYAIDIDVSTHDGEGEFTHGFDNFSTSVQNLPEGWTLTARQGRNEEDFGVAAPSIRLRDDNATLTVAMPGETLDKVDFWFMPTKGGLILSAESCEGGEWKEVWKHVADRKRAINETVEVAAADSVRFVVTREEGVTGGYVLMDDITLHYVYDRFTPDNTVEVGPASGNAFGTNWSGNCHYRVTGLDATRRYAYSLTALNGSRRSLVSDVMPVEDTGINGVAGIDDSAEKATVVYNLQGIRIHTDVNELPSGVYIINGKKMMILR